MDTERVILSIAMLGASSIERMGVYQTFCLGK